ncbi:MAG TPA: dTDP-glucose 4,6-dehydratase [Gemmatimonadaceae bacterium]|nr:dTDP-glucose 4,6-dehydratase [Gemmatimonadaceae bacterium]
MTSHITRKILVTGGCGFIGSNLIRLLRRDRPSWRIVNLDLMTYAANAANLGDVRDGPHYRFVRGDVADRSLVAELYASEGFDAVIHCAAESHVDRSIHDSGQFLRTNVEGTLVLLEAAAATGGVRHLQMSTDEVYGSLALDEPSFTESTPLAPRSPYSASKAAADLLALAFHHTHAQDVVITRCSNNYGPYQHPEKLIPLMITSALRQLPLPVYGDGKQRRDWIFVEDHCRGVLAALEDGASGAVYNFGGGAERENLQVVRQVVAEVGASESLIRHVADRPGHDRRYSVSFDKAARELGWRPAHAFEDGLRETIGWYRANPQWWTATAANAYTESEDRISRWARTDAPTRSAPAGKQS